MFWTDIRIQVSRTITVGTRQVRGRPALRGKFQISDFSYGYY